MSNKKGKEDRLLELQTHHLIWKMTKLLMTEGAPSDSPSSSTVTCKKKDWWKKSRVCVCVRQPYLLPACLDGPEHTHIRVKVFPDSTIIRCLIQEQWLKRQTAVFCTTSIQIQPFSLLICRKSSRWGPVHHPLGPADLVQFIVFLINCCWSHFDLSAISPVFWSQLYYSFAGTNISKTSKTSNSLGGWCCRLFCANKSSILSQT